MERSTCKVNVKSSSSGIYWLNNNMYFILVFSIAQFSRFNWGNKNMFVHSFLFFFFLSYCCSVLFIKPLTQLIVFTYNKEKCGIWDRMMGVDLTKISFQALGIEKKHHPGPIWTFAIRIYFPLYVWACNEYIMYIIFQCQVIYFH